MEAVDLWVLPKALLDIFPACAEEPHQIPERKTPITVMIEPSS